jgi:imidazolonepropionase-like amidohydrolase
MTNPLLIIGQISLVLFGVVSVATAPHSNSRDTVIKDVTLISPERVTPLLHADVVLRNGKIVEIGTNLAPGQYGRQIDGRGKFLIPGLIDSHVHVGHSAALDDDAVDTHPSLWAAYRRQVPRAYLAFGFTSVVDLDLKPSDEAWFEGTPLHPQLYSCGRGIKVAGGYMAFKIPPPSSPSFPNLVYEPKEVAHWPKSLRPDDYSPERAVSRSVEAPAICVKAFVEPGFGMFHWPYMHTETLRRIQAAAREHKLVLMVHANNVDSWQSALDARADVIAHGLWVWPGDLENSVPPPAVRGVIAAAARAGTYVQPTLQVVSGESALIDPSLLDDPRLALSLPPSVIAYLRSAEGAKARAAISDEYRKASPPPGFEPLLRAAIERTRQAFKIMVREHVPLILGSDTPGVEGFGNPPGFNGRLEIQDWADAGAPAALILRAATIQNAIALGLSREVGSIEVGKRADLLLLKENPLVNVSAYDSIDTVFLNGEPISREILRAHD